MADEQHRRAVLALDVHQQFGDGRLHRDVERRDRLVGDHDLGVAGEGAGDADALLLAAGELARHAGGEGARQAHEVEQFEHPRLALGVGLADAEFLQRANDLRADAMAGVERVERVLEHHLDRGDGRGVALLDGQRVDVDVAERRRVPAVAVSRPSSTLASVDLPQPNSPTMATVSASRASKLIVSLALTTRPVAAEELVEPTW